MAAFRSSRVPALGRFACGLPLSLLVLVTSFSAGCGPAVSDQGGSGSATDSETSAGTTTENATAPGESSSGFGSTTPEPEASSSGAEPEPPPPSCPNGLAPGGWELGPVMLSDDCEDPLVDDCRQDIDHDGVPFTCDNADDVTNPSQQDADADGIGDFADLCPVHEGDPNNSADSDNDGIGNACDLCPRPAHVYNTDLLDLGVPTYILIRSNPSQLDTDQDGIGDACDNCPTVPNCGDFGPDNPGSIFEDVPREDASICQADANQDGIGDACEGLASADAAGVAGFSDADDFDQDGLPNAEDACPRLAVVATACEGEGDCPTGATCGSTGWCNHVDTDADGVGNICDTCPEAANPAQRSNAAEADMDDGEGDFIGAACELGEGCADRRNRSAPAFFTHSAYGMCCVRSGLRESLNDPDGRPIRPDCDGETNCAEIPGPAWDTPGVGVLPIGCDEVLLDACTEEASPVTLEDVGGDLEALWAFACSLPPADQDLDGIGESCDYCPFAFDPTNSTFVDDNGMSWPNDGAFCNGDYYAGNLDPANGCQP